MKHQQERRQFHPAVSEAAKRQLSVVSNEEPAQVAWAHAWRSEHDTDDHEQSAA